VLVKDVPFEFNEECMSAFLRLKEALTTAAVMQVPNWELPFEVMCDVSDYAVGAILGQRKDNKPYALYYVSRTIDEAQVDYATTEKEFSAVVFTLENFWSYLVNYKVIVFNDHAALKNLMKKSGSRPRLIH